MIDAHVHFWRYACSTHAWIDASMEVLARDFLPNDLEPQLASSGTASCIAVQAAQTLDETRFLLELARRHASIAGVVGWVDLTDPRVDDVLELLVDEGRGARRGDARASALVGIRHIAQDESDPRFLVRSDVLRGIAAVGARGLAYDVLVRPPQWSAALDLARALPDVRFVLDHLGKPPIATGELDAWRAWILELAREPNVVAKVSGLVTEAERGRAQRDEIARCIDDALEAFGPARLVLGSDWPVCLLAAGRRDALELARSRVAALSARERAAIESGTASRLYRIAERA